MSSSEKVTPKSIEILQGSFELMLQKTAGGKLEVTNTVWSSPLSFTSTDLFRTWEIDGNIYILISETTVLW